MPRLKEVCIRCFHTINQVLASMALAVDGERRRREGCKLFDLFTPSRQAGSAVTSVRRVGGLYLGLLVATDDNAGECDKSPLRKASWIDLRGWKRITPTRQLADAEMERHRDIFVLFDALFDPTTNGPIN